jgi:predicted transcriptional regulator
MTRDYKAVSLKLSQSDFAYLQDLSNRFGIRKSEFLRLLVHSLKIGEAALNNKATTVKVGGYGYEFRPELIQEFAKRIEDVLEAFSKEIKITPVKTPTGMSKAVNRRIKAFKAIA